MGIKDLVQLYEVVKICRSLEKEHNWGYQFTWDQGTFETAIIIHNNDGLWKAGRLVEGWENMEIDTSMFCPDIIDFNKRIIIEYDETPGKPRKGARLAKKGHDPDGMDYRTARRNEAYARAGFEVCIIHDIDSEKTKKSKLKAFFVKNYTR